jgi:2-polyprenyl-3-methyl-5-hydroxy-6-metoxy-1,4-benzoquinol methylase
MTISAAQDYCTICGSVTLTPLLTVRSNADGPLSGEYLINHCTQCSAGFTSPLPPDSELAKHYQHGVYAKSGGRLNLLLDLLLSTLADQRFREIGRFYNAPGRLLDVGCGKGRFLSRARKYGWDAQGTDTAPGQVLAARERYNLRVSLGEVWEACFADKYFDVVTSWHVLEHLANPHLVVNEIRRILTPGGLFVSEVPNFASWQATIGAEHWFQLDVPRHLVHYTPLAMNRLLEQHGFEVLQTSTFSLELGPFGMLQTLLNRMDLPPNLLFQWLKKTSRCGHGEAAINLAAAFLALVPSLLLEALASAPRRGSVIRTVAKLK